MRIVQLARRRKSILFHKKRRYLNKWKKNKNYFGSSVTSNQGGSDMALFPSVRRLLIEYGLNPSKIGGSGIRGKILKGDVLKFIEVNKLNPLDLLQMKSLNVVEGKGSPSVSHESGSKTSTSTSAPNNKISTPSSIPNFVDIPNSAMRNVIAKRLALSKSSNPHAYMSSEIYIDKILSIRKDLNVGDIKLSINDFIIKAVAKTLEKVKELNISIGKDKIIYNESIDISVAVAIESGLITPIIFNANKLGLLEINTKVKELSALAKKGALKPEQFQGGSFSISNLGMFGIDSFSAVINPPQGAILTVGNKKDIIKSQEGRLQNESYLTVQLCYHAGAIDLDHSAKFLDTLKKMMENPSILI